MAMSEDELREIVKAQIEAATGDEHDAFARRRQKAIDYYNGTMLDLPALDGWSTVTTRELSDAIGWILPSLMRVFAAGDKVVEYEPSSGKMDGADEAAKDATDLVNYVFQRECGGYTVLQSAFHDSFLYGNGVLKAYWDESKTYCLEEYRGLDEDQFAGLLSEEDVEVTQHSARPGDPTEEEEQAAAMGMPVEPRMVHDVRIRKRESEGKLRIEVLPPEEFLIEKGAKTVQDASFVGHRRLVTRSELISQGYDYDDVMGIEAYSTIQDSMERNARWTTFQPTNGLLSVKSDTMMEEIEITECYLRADVDGDDWPEWRKVVVGGSGAVLLANDEWPGEHPFADVCPMPVPHRWVGMSMLDQLEDLQRIKTALTRATLNNLYLTSMPQREVVEGQVTNPEELLNPTIGGVVFVKTPGAVRDMAVPFTAAQSFQMLAYIDELGERRTGVSRQSMALDPETMQNQTAQAVISSQAAAGAKLELYARNIAEGLRVLFRKVLKIVVANHAEPRSIRVRGEMKEMQPKRWPVDMDASVNIGLGTGSRDRDMAVLMQVLAQQKEVLQLMGPQNPIAGIDKVLRTLHKVVEASGLKAPESYFGIPTDEEIGQFMQQMGQQKPDAKVQAEMQLKQMDMQLRQQEMQAKIEIQRQQGMLDLEIQQQKLAQELQFQREKLQMEKEAKAAEMILRRDEMQIEAELTAASNAAKAAAGQGQMDNNIIGFRG